MINGSLNMPRLSLSSEESIETSSAKSSEQASSDLHKSHATRESPKTALLNERLARALWDAPRAEEYLELFVRDHHALKVKCDTYELAGLHYKDKRDELVRSIAAKDKDLIDKDVELAYRAGEIARLRRELDQCKKDIAIVHQEESADLRATHEAREAKPAIKECKALQHEATTVVVMPEGSEADLVVELPSPVTNSGQTMPSLSSIVPSASSSVVGK
ncbi:uncharacterized protein L969DRAFT_93066 [Mixia osmundae IAM 14324]|uniref:Uncharacterized protein n=1 Tax=Mixia osmundae (strain CBS 9802 / IAM 14324 / JCM 22182 / KY 12970) TaxID=764103 RepID=G7E675_MIXOS|nr:uncharacterized protein L969DRAFT_93066 [Mixia osmundae IAM 14324]KEI40511.1 hypothetical protein L969DRAFT_93066 [Mixia osmundae IAM 14324]GAA98335.1 hypothetical protein E5Q_05020 [Mixia osmundae IAM 14324]